jgi:hypothetical protein
MKDLIFLIKKAALNGSLFYCLSLNYTIEQIAFLVLLNHKIDLI